MKKTLLAKSIIWTISLEAQEMRDIVTAKARSSLPGKKQENRFETNTESHNGKLQQQERARAKRRLHNLVQYSLSAK